MNSETYQRAVILGYQPIEGEARRVTVNLVEIGQHPRVSPFGWATLAPTAQAHLSDRQRIIVAVLFVLIPIFIYILMTIYEARRERLRKEIAHDLIERAKGEHGWKFTRFELGAWIQRNHSKKPILHRFWPKPRLGIDEVLEQAVAELITAGENTSPANSERKPLIKKFEGLHSDPNNISDSLGPSPSTVFLIAAVPVIVLFLAIQEVPPIGEYLAGIFGP